MDITTTHVEQTESLGRLIGQLARQQAQQNASLCIALDGMLGAGKTHLTRGIAQGAAVADPSLVSSPTYVLLNIYEGPIPLYHLDAYRVESPEDFAALGFDEFLSGKAIIVVEWASRVADLLPADRLHLSIEHGENDSERRIHLQSTGPLSATLANQIASQWPNVPSDNGC